MTYGSFVLARYGQGQTLDLRAMLRRIFLFPPMIALLVGLAMMNWAYPPGLVSVLEGAAITLTPLVVTAIGYQLKLRLPMSIMAPFGAGLAIKLLIAPLTLLLAYRLFGWSGLPYDVNVTEAGMPPIITASALAVAAGMNAELAVALAGLGLLCAFVTLPLLYGLLLF